MKTPTGLSIVIPAYNGEGRLAASLEAITAFATTQSYLVEVIPPNLHHDDVAIGSRELPDSQRINEPCYRHLIGRAFSTYVKAMSMSGIEDTQCGFKRFRQSVARELFSLQIIDGWAFDAEVLMIALRRGYRIVEVPIEWHYANSKVSPVRDALHMVREVARIRANTRMGRHDGALSALAVARP